MFKHTKMPTKAGLSNMTKSELKFGKEKDIFQATSTTDLVIDELLLVSFGA